MKIIFVLTIALMSSVSFACSDFSGDYHTENATYYLISQNDCTSMDVSDETSSTRMFFDGVERQLFEYEIIVNEQVHAKVVGYISSKMISEKWVYNERVVFQYENGQITEEKKWAEVSITPETDLLTVLHNDDGSIELFIDKRIRE